MSEAPKDEPMTDDDELHQRLVAFAKTDAFKARMAEIEADMDAGNYYEANDEFFENIIKEIEQKNSAQK